MPGAQVVRLSRLRNLLGITTIRPCAWQPGSVRPESLAVIGLGAIGGSVAWQARRAGIPRVIGFTPDTSEGVRALKAGAVSDIAGSAERAVRGAQLVLIAAPPRATLELLGPLGRRLEDGALLTDVASIKAPVMARAVAEGLGKVFAGGHPFAGTHGTGFEFARPDRFPGVVTYVCATGEPGGDDTARQVMHFWHSVLQAEPVLIDAGQHDRQLAWTSHLPQAVAYALAHTLADRPLTGTSFASGARDTTRLAASSPELWIDIFLQNREPIVEALRRAETDLGALRSILEAGDERGLRAWLEHASAFRRGLDR